MKDALFHLNPLEGVGLQGQLRAALTASILSRRMRPGEKLPSSRAMARRLGVSRNTVTLAYQALAEDGYIEARPRSGYVVAADAPVSAPDAKSPPSPDGALDWGARLARRYSGIPAVEKPLNWREYPYPFIYGQGDPSLFSHSEWRDCARQAMSLRNFDRAAGDFGLADDPMLVDYIRARTLPPRGVLAGPDEILVTLGAQNALWLAAAVVPSGGIAAIEDPAYSDVRAMLIAQKLRPRPIPVDADGLPADDRLKGVDAVFCTPTHQTPTTVTMSLARRKALLAAAEREDFIIVEDDYEFEMSPVNPPIPALKSLDETGRVIYVGSFSKTLFPGLRLGYLVAPAPVIREARALRRLMLRHPPGLIQRAAAYFLALGHFDALVKRLRAAFSARRTALLAGLEPMAEDGVRVVAYGGVSAWVQGPDALDADVLAARLRGRGVLIEPGAPFFAGESPPRNYIRLACSSIASERIPAGLQIMREEMNAALRSGA